MTVKYKCSSCNYNFEMNSDRRITKCPYCGKTSLRTMSRGPNFVDNILKEM